MVASIIAYSLSGSSANVLKRLSHTPLFAHRENRVWMFFQLPKRSGRSRHGAPERNFQITASMKSRLEKPIAQLAVAADVAGPTRQQMFNPRKLVVAQSVALHRKASQKKAPYESRFT